MRRRPFSLAIVLSATLALAFIIAEQQQHARAHVAAASHARERPTQVVAGSRVMAALMAQTPKANTTATGSTAIREVDLDGLKKLLQRSPEKDARPLLVNFWATWCEPCREEFPDLVRIHADYGKSNLEFITVSLDDPEETQTSVNAFLREMKAPMPAFLLNVIDPETVISMVDPEWHGGLPATFLYDASGRIVFKHTGRVNAAELRRAIDKVTSGK